MPKNHSDDFQGSLFLVPPDEAPTSPLFGPAAAAQTPFGTEPEDIADRRAAVDTHSSVLVQAPAGAGKTGLLTERFLALLAEVDEPESVLAITFTRAATAEMRSRVLDALQAASSAPAPDENSRPTERFAYRALQQSEAHGWRLLEQPHRLDIQTIDSLCLRIAHGQPLLARLGGQLAPTESAGEMYSAAARRTLMQLGSTRDEELHAALQRLLLLQDNNLRACERMLAEMLARRDAWLHNLPSVGRFSEHDWSDLRTRWEKPFADENTRVLRRLRERFGAHVLLVEQLLDHGHYAARNVEDGSLALLDSLTSLPGHEPAHRSHWECLIHLLLTKDNNWRREWRVDLGFPPAGKGLGADERKARKDGIKDCVSRLAEAGGDELLQLLCSVRSLPRPGYTDEQWTTLRSVVRVLRHATAELRVVFAENDSVDFVEIAHAAEIVLDDPSGVRGLLASESKQHILVDEFQDTSRRQHALLAKLLREWQHGDGRTIFLVGDPLQSIYGFRQAEVALFHETREYGLLCGDDGRRHPCSPLQLTHNFRTDRQLVEALNARLPNIFTAGRDTFQPAHSTRTRPGSGMHVHAFFTAPEGTESRQRARTDEAARVVSILREELPRIHAAQASGESEYKVAILVRARNHLAAILPALREAGIPYRAVDLEGLNTRQEILDLEALLRALLHPADRVAWLSTLRAPWCGLSIADLHILTGEDDPLELRRTIPEQIETRARLLSADGQAQLARTWGILEAARAARFSDGNTLSLSAWLERTWIALGGPDCLDASARENAGSFFSLLDGLQPSGLQILRGDFGAQLARLCAAPDPTVSERFGIQLMTIHKSKGLGFHTVVVPGLERKGNHSDKELIAMLERSSTRAPGETDLLVAPAGSVEDDEDPIYKWIRKEKKQRESEELRRLFYVACTRARERLHLLLTVEDKGADHDPAPRNPDSLLYAAWPALREDVLPQRPATAETAPATIGPLAASAESAAAPAPLRLNRLSATYTPSTPEEDVPFRNSTQLARTAADQPAYHREATGSPTARARGVALHALLEALTAHLAAGHLGPSTELRDKLAALARRTLRERAVPLSEAAALASDLSTQALSVLEHPIGSWLLGSHHQAQAESAWQGLDAEGRLRTLRVDRTFLAGPRPGGPGEDHLWIVDYKTVSASELPPAADRQEWRDTQRTKWSPQLEAYRAALLNGAAHPIRYAIYFPALGEILVWDEENRWIDG